MGRISKWVCGWVGESWMQPRLDASGYLCGWVREQWIHVRLDAGGCVHGWENNGCESDWLQVGVWMCGGNNGCKSDLYPPILTHFLSSTIPIPPEYLTSNSPTPTTTLFLFPITCAHVSSGLPPTPSLSLLSFQVAWALVDSVSAG